jgi:riboflavin synthase alpha subunit
MKLTATASKSLVALAALAAIGAGAGITAIASAQSAPSTAASTTRPWMGMHRGMGRHGVHGTVSAINGTSLTITNSDGTSYTVDASSAKVSKVVSLQVGDIQVGDQVGVMGSVNGTQVVAKHIMDGIPPTAQGPPASASPGN